MPNLQIKLWIAPAMTFILILLSIRQCQQSQSHKNWFGQKPIPNTYYLYPHLDIKRGNEKMLVKFNNESSKTFKLSQDEQGLWQMNYPYQDRANPYLMNRLIKAISTAKVVDFIPSDKQEDNLSRLGFYPDPIKIEMPKTLHHPAISFYIGGTGVWKLAQKNKKTFQFTEYIWPQYKKDFGSYIYLIDQNIRQLFPQNGKFIQDYHPLFFEPAKLIKLTINHPKYQILLEKSENTHTWKIKKPIQTLANTDTVHQLIRQLLALEAFEISQHSFKYINRQENIRVKLYFQDAKSPLTLAITPQIYHQGHYVYYPITVSDRDSLFKIKKSQIDLVPLSLDQLRSRSLTHLSPQEIESISIRKGQTKPVLLKKDKTVWKLINKGKQLPLHSKLLKELLKVLTQDTITEFISDTFTNSFIFAPNLQISIYSNTQKRPQILGFFEKKDGTFWVHKQGSFSIYRISSENYQKIKARTYQWKSDKIWDISPVNISQLTRKTSHHPKLKLQYNYLLENWLAEQSDRNVTPFLNTYRATYFLETLANLKVFQWVSPNDKAARKILKKPLLQFSLTTTNPQNPQTATTYELLLSPTSINNPNSKFYFAKIKGSSDVFMLKLSTIKELLIPLLEKG